MFLAQMTLHCCTISPTSSLVLALRPKLSTNLPRAAPTRETPELDETFSIRQNFVLKFPSRLLPRSSNFPGSAAHSFMSFRPLLLPNSCIPLCISSGCARHELGTRLPINRGSNFARFSHGIPPLLDDCQEPGTRGIRSGFRPFEGEKSGGLGDCQAVRQSRDWPPALEALVGRVGGRSRTCCLELEPRRSLPAPASELLMVVVVGLVGGWQPAEKRTLVDCRTADPPHASFHHATGSKLFTTGTTYFIIVWKKLY